jgi:hypothetical protein
MAAAGETNDPLDRIFSSVEKRLRPIRGRSTWSLTTPPTAERRASRGTEFCGPRLSLTAHPPAADRPISGETCAFPRSVAEESGQLSGPRHSSPLQRHSENETRFLGRGSGYKSAAVRLSDLRGDVKAKSETLPAIAHIAAEERLEELGHC